jgi:energy-coupling factor transporter ATP-binding protein EcfA2
MQTARSKPLIELRPYQHAAMEAITRGFTEYQHQLAVKPTGSGKTVLFSALAAHYQPRRTLVLAHREELIDQAVDKIMRTTGLEADVEMAGARASHHAPVVVASVQTLMREQRRSRWPRDHFGLIVVDECFPAGTLVDGRPIETISVGDVVSAFDHGLGVAVRRPVTRVFRRETGRICHLTLPSLLGRLHLRARRSVDIAVRGVWHHTKFKSRPAKAAEFRWSAGAGSRIIAASMPCAPGASTARWNAGTQSSGSGEPG